MNKDQYFNACFNHCAHWKTKNKQSKSIMSTAIVIYYHTYVSIDQAKSYLNILMQKLS